MNFPDRKIPRLWLEEDVRRLRMMYHQAGSGKLNLRELASSFGRLPSAISNKAASLGISVRRRKWYVPKRKYATDTEMKAGLSASRKKWIAEHGHPRGSLGMKHSEKTKAAIGVKSRMAHSRRSKDEIDRNSLKAVLTKMARYGKAGNFAGGNAYSRCARGVRKDIGSMFFRSRWEANYARYLNWQKARGEIKEWRYEATTFRFDGIQRGTLTYLPDFDVYMNDGTVERHEVKGWMDKKSVTKLRRMKKYHPKEKLVVIDEKRYKGIEKMGRIVIPGWELKGAIL